jgi:hypothetical protein
MAQGPNPICRLFFVNKELLEHIVSIPLGFICGFLCTKILIIWPFTEKVC